MKKIWGSLLALACVLILAPRSLAQSTEATVTGQITDQSGKFVPNTTVVFTNINTNVASTAETNSDGIYSLANLKPGIYRANITKESFKSVVKDNIELHVQDNVSINFSLQIGSVNETVTVQGGTPLLNTQDATVGTVVDRQFVANMPLNGRSFQSLITLTPGVVVSQASSADPGQFSINGQRPDSNYFTVDGVSANVGVASGGNILAGSTGSGVQPSTAGGFNNLVSVDAMQEFKIQTSTFAPEYGRTPGGQIAIVTRSGTNQFHGDAFDYLRNNDFDANDWFVNARGGVHTAEHQNDFGGVVGGPVKKDKLFFFASYEGLRLTVPGQINFYVPSLCARGTGTCPTGATPAIPAIRPYLNAFPQPNAAGCTGVLADNQEPILTPFCGAYPNVTKLNATSGRGDYIINSKMTLFGRVNYAPSNAGVRSTGTSIMEPQINLTSYTAGLTYTISPSLMNDFRFNYSFVTGYATSTADNFGGAVPVSPSTIFPSGIVVPPTGVAATVANSRFFFVLSTATQWRVGDETHSQSHQLDYVDNLSWSRGTHQLKFGVDLRRLTPIQARSQYQYFYQFLSNATFIAGTPDILSVNTNPLAEFLLYNLSLYAQDTWKVNHRLTITYGLRWDVDPPIGTMNNTPIWSFNQLNLANLGATVVAPIGTPIYHTPWDSFAPRLGIAYQMSQDPRWGRVVRLGGGVFYDTAGDIISSAQTINGSTLSLTNVANFPATLGQLNLGSANNVAPYNFVVSTVSPNLRLPRVYQMNAAIEQSLGTKQTLTVTYAGALGRQLLVIYAFPPGPAGSASAVNLPNGFIAMTNGSTSSYHSLQALFQRRFSAGLQAMASYTWSHSIDTGSNAENEYPDPNIYALRQERGPSDFDIRQQFQMAISYNIPHPGKDRFSDTILGHWGTDLIFRARTAPPINVLDGSADLTETYPNAAISTRPNLVPGAPIYLYGAQCAAAYAVKACPGGWALNPGSKTSIAAGIPAAFARQAGCPATGLCKVTSEGNLGRNSLRGYGWNALDLTMRREFPIHEKIALQFRSDFFNLLNHPAFAYAPNASTLNILNGAFGKTTTALDNALASSGGVPAFNPLYQIGGPRSIQLSLKLVF